MSRYIANSMYKKSQNDYNILLRIFYGITWILAQNYYVEILALCLALLLVSAGINFWCHIYCNFLIFLSHAEILYSVCQEKYHLKFSFTTSQKLHVPIWFTYLFAWDSHGCVMYLCSWLMRCNYQCMPTKCLCQVALYLIKQSYGILSTCIFMCSRNGIITSSQDALPLLS